MNACPHFGSLIAGFLVWIISQKCMDMRERVSSRHLSIEFAAPSLRRFNDGRAARNQVLVMLEILHTLPPKGRPRWITKSPSPRSSAGGGQCSWPAVHISWPALHTCAVVPPVYSFFQGSIYFAFAEHPERVTDTSSTPPGLAGTPIHIANFAGVAMVGLLVLPPRPGAFVAVARPVAMQIVFFPPNVPSSRDRSTTWFNFPPP